MTTAAPFPIETDAAGPFAGIAAVRLEQAGSPMVVLDEPLIQRIEATLLALPKGAAGLVLASASSRVFIAGADLRSIQALGDTELDRYLAYGQRVFGMISALPFPTVAAINGAALGGGLEIAMHCDALVGAPSPTGKPYPVGLPEAGLSICPGWGGTNLLPARIDPADAIARTAAGKPMNFDEARGAGLFDMIAPSAELLIETCKNWIVSQRGRGVPTRDGAPARWIGRAGTRERVAAALPALRDALPHTEPALAVVDAVRAGLDGGWQAALEVERRELVRLRSTPAGKAAIEAFFEKSAKK
ncbi:MAG: enoyl-CoA hydratase/isomerase family protein [Phycisphaeraceae bacterium]|nr:enoyl-CoA hydratase/isomerase family protein [Phycisphaeraceae bacterium]MBX3406095.1 enoyl-CoA hydratase/isomerase family protein [Phycisphaeraceae bacterium]